jgi:hypothetical protein
VSLLEHPAFVRTKDRVAIVGFAETKNLAPMKDESFEIWGLNDLHKQVPRFDRWFEMHPRESLTSQHRDDEHFKWLASIKDKPVYMLDAQPEIPASVKWWKQEAIDFFGTDYFTNSISYMLGSAIMMGFKELHVYGVDMAVDTEYGDQRPSCEFFLGWARGSGMLLYIPPAAHLLKAAGMYGYDTAKMVSFAQSMRLRKQELLARLAQCDAEIARWNQQKLTKIGELQQCDAELSRWVQTKFQIVGALENTDHVNRNWMGNGENNGVLQPTTG